MPPARRSSITCMAVGRSTLRLLSSWSPSLLIEIEAGLLLTVDMAIQCRRSRSVPAKALVSRPPSAFSVSPMVLVVRAGRSVPVGLLWLSRLSVGARMWTTAHLTAGHHGVGPLEHDGQHPAGSRQVLGGKI